MKDKQTVYVPVEASEVPDPLNDNWILVHSLGIWLKPITLPSEEEIRQLIDQFYQPLDITGLSPWDIDDMEKEYDKFNEAFSKAIIALMKGEK